MQARLPIVVSDVRTMAAEVKRLGNGEVFIAEDVADFVVAVKKVLADKGQYQSVYTEKVLIERSWELQAENLVKIYNRIADAKPTARAHMPFKVTTS
jgi:glycosyltransferase involved in cell wall biosynthesis